MTNKKGIVFKQSNNRNLLLIHPDSLQTYLSQLPRNENGWIAFEFANLPKVSQRGKFAEIVALEKTPS